MKTTKRLYGANTVLYTSVTVMCPVPFPRLCFLLQCSVKLAACFGFGLVILQSSHGWNFFLLSHIGVQPTKLYGSGTFKLAPKSTTTSGSTTLYGHYVHPKAELGLSVNVSSYGSFSISGGSNYDERGSQKTISW